ncbi:hypothetical protein [Corynebacterium silvaticum]|uniref:Uncharacterized protein n=1 Tax=Corynebacterium silvaticum TaxID=2320431 RepID=A0A7Y4UPR7_9CORY|nr:hypothetical protein [Corynebacterium silvaticum]ARU46639.1 hypothetical protein CBE74_09370 [Corynebacterium silvaticum]MBH5299803.1 hypothetical protein [Corynebacterium silvaticum]NOM63879.1 hypothetical protein [Corynebacterium silvaticum]NON71124.1 hypothetical protein [Corynebacterium silvaticum]TFA91967.1 hypothetical protein EU802_08465 [Corynebacterium silvaticum]
MSISRNFDEYLADRGLVQLAEVIPENECQEFCPADSWYEGQREEQQLEEQGAAQNADNDTSGENFPGQSVGGELAQAQKLVEDLLLS